MVVSATIFLFPQEVDYISRYTQKTTNRVTVTPIIYINSTAGSRTQILELLHRGPIITVLQLLVKTSSTGTETVSI